MKNLFDYKIEDLENYFLNIGEKKFKATQVFEWLYLQKNYNIEEFSNIKKDLREKLKEEFNTNFIKIKSKEEDIGVKKYLFELFDGEKIEAVLMEHDEAKPSGVVIEVLQKGYMYKDKVIRPAMVKVNE